MNEPLINDVLSWNKFNNDFSDTLVSKYMEKYTLKGHIHADDLFGLS